MVRNGGLHQAKALLRLGVGWGSAVDSQSVLMVSLPSFLDGSNLRFGAIRSSLLTTLLRTASAGVRLTRKTRPETRAAPATRKLRKPCGGVASVKPPRPPTESDRDAADDDADDAMSGVRRVRIGGEDDDDAEAGGRRGARGDRVEEEETSRFFCILHECFAERSVCMRYAFLLEQQRGTCEGRASWRVARCRI